MYAFALTWASVCVFLFIVAVVGIRIAWELLKLAMVAGFAGACLILLGVI